MVASEAGGANRYLQVAATARPRVQGSISCRAHFGPLRVLPPAAASHQASIAVGQEIQKSAELKLLEVVCRFRRVPRGRAIDQAPSVEPVCNLSSPEKTRRKNSTRFGIMSLIFSRSPSGIRSG